MAKSVENNGLISDTFIGTEKGVVHERKIKDFYTPYIYPSDCGLRGETNYFVTYNEENTNDGLIIATTEKTQTFDSTCVFMPNKNFLGRQNLSTNLIEFNLKVCLQRDKQYNNRFLEIVFVIKVGT